MRLWLPTCVRNSRVYRLFEAGLLCVLMLPIAVVVTTLGLVALALHPATEEPAE